MKLAERFIIAWRDSPERPRLNWREENYNGADLLFVLLRLATKMRDQEFSHYEAWSYWGANHPLGLMMPVACALLGKVWAPLSPMLKREEAVGLAAVMGACLIDLESGGDWTSAWSGHGDPVLLKQVDEIAVELLELVRQSKESAFLLSFQTSGSTGHPKQVLLPESHVLANLLNSISVQKLTAEDRVLLVLSLSHSGGLCIQALPGLLSGAYLLLQSGFAVQSFIEALTTEAADLTPTTTLLVPSFLHALARSERAKNIDWSLLRHVGVGSAPLSRRLFEAYRGLPIRLLHIYGLTEAGPVLASCYLTETTPALMDIMPIGTVCPAFEWQIGAEGELRVRGPAARSTYAWRSVEKAEAEMEAVYDDDGWVLTGDSIVANNGLLYFTHRLDETLNVGGMKVAPSRIEAVFEAMPGVKGCVVKSRVHAVFGNILVALLELDGASDLLSPRKKRELVREAKKSLADFETPREIEFVASLPRSILGKKLRKH